MKVLPLNLETGSGMWKREWTRMVGATSFAHFKATGVRIFAGGRFLEEAAMQSIASGEDGCVEAQEIATAKLQDREEDGYCIDLSNDAARYLLGSLGYYASIWGNWGFEYASSVRSALALERHLTKYGLEPMSGTFTS